MKYLSILLITLSCHADWTELNPLDFSIQNPPREGSSEYKKDFSLLHKYQNDRTEEDCSLAESQLYPKFNLIFTPEQTGLSKKEIQKYNALFTKAINAGITVSDYYKEKFQRARPYDTDTSISPCIKKPGGHKSYPSSHSLVGILGACLLAEVYQDDATPIRAYGKRVGDLRAIVGVHHPSDIKAGQSLGQQICETLLADEDFQNALRSNAR